MPTPQSKSQIAKAKLSKRVGRGKTTNLPKIKSVSRPITTNYSSKKIEVKAVKSFEKYISGQFRNQRGNPFNLDKEAKLLGHEFKLAEIAVSKLNKDVLFDTYFDTDAGFTIEVDYSHGLDIDLLVSFKVVENIYDDNGGFIASLFVNEGWDYDESYTTISEFKTLTGANLQNAYKKFLVVAQKKVIKVSKKLLQEILDDLKFDHAQDIEYETDTYKDVIASLKTMYAKDVADAHKRFTTKSK